MVDSNIRVCILGGGVIGASTAYYLSKRGYENIVILERLGVASCSSGKAGGFLAKDWCDSRGTGDLAKRSYELHKELGKLFDTDYRSVNTLSVESNDKEKIEKVDLGNIKLFFL